MFGDILDDIVIINLDASFDAFILDKADQSVTRQLILHSSFIIYIFIYFKLTYRSKEYLKCLFKLANLKILLDEDQEGFPDELYPVVMFALTL